MSCLVMRQMPKLLIEKKERSERKVWEVEIGRAGGRSVDEARLAQVSTMTADGEHETSRSSLNMAAFVA